MKIALTNKKGHIRNIVTVGQLTYAQMAEVVQAIRDEVKTRNSIGINLYTGYIDQAVMAIREISGGEAGNFTSESGPKEPKPKVK